MDDEITALEYLFETDHDLAVGVEGGNLYLEHKGEGVWHVYNYADQLIDWFEVE